MKTFPKFLKAMPEFLGLNFYDLGMVLIALYSSMIFSFEPIVTLMGSILLIVLSKVIRKNCDLVGFFLPKKKEIHLSSTRRGQDDASL